MKSNFSIDICACQELSPTLKEKLYKKPLLPTTLVRIAREFIQEGNIQNVRDRMDLDPKDLRWFEGENECFLIDLWDAPKDARTFRSIIDWKKPCPKSRNYYRIKVNKHCKRNTVWMCLATEICHLLMHGKLLQTRPRDRKVNQVLMANAEAKFFSCLCFWPLEQLFPKSGVFRTDKAVVKKLFDFYMSRYEKYGFKMPNKADAEQQCWTFFNRMRSFLPEMYTYITNRRP